MRVELTKVSKKFNNIEVLRDISLTVKKQEIICILGPSGCGKSTILNLISQLITPDKGFVENRSENIGYVFQEDRLIPWKTVYENIKIVKENKEDEINRLISDVGLKGFENNYPKELSGGMRQRCSIARAFNYQSDLLLMDEPFKSLDYNLRIGMIEHLIELWEKSKNSIIFVTHEIDEALLLGDEIIVLSNRPTSVVNKFKIKDKQSKRKLNDANLTQIRNEIIDIFTTKNKEEQIYEKIS